MDKSELKDLILLTVRKRNPDTIEQLIAQIIQDNKEVSEDEIISLLHELEDEKKLKLAEAVFPMSAKDYVFSSKAVWYWVTMAISIFAFIIFFTVNASFFPVIYLRNLLGLVFVLYLPGYALVKTLYPLNVPLKTRTITLDSIERIVLSLGLSIVVTTLSGLLLYYTPIGLNFEPVNTCILVITLVFANWGIYREYEARKALRKPRKTSAYFV
jgi:uncharacterized membrane protein